MSPTSCISLTFLKYQLLKKTKTTKNLFSLAHEHISTVLNPIKQFIINEWQ